MWKLAKAAWRALSPLGLGVLLCNLLFWFYPGTLLGLGIYGANQRVAAVASGQPTPPFSPADLAAVLLAVATVVLATVAFLVSLGAFVGFAEIRNLVARLTREDRESITQQMNAMTEKNGRDMRDIVFEIEARFERLRKNIQENMDQAEGLKEGAEADAIAKAAGDGEPDPIS